METNDNSKKRTSMMPFNSEKSFLYSASIWQKRLSVVCLSRAWAYERPDTYLFLFRKTSPGRAEYQATLANLIWAFQLDFSGN